MTSAADASVGPGAVPTTQDRTEPVSTEAVPTPSAAARAVFGPTLELATQYAELLARVGTAHGHLGPREIPRLWDRHLANSAVIGDRIPQGVRVVDVGSGAGLPGIALAIRRADLHVDLVEPMARRVEFLRRAVSELGLGDRVRVVHGRAEERAVQMAVANAEWVTARAVAPLVRLAGWCLPLLTPGGQLLALKGSTAESEAALLVAESRTDVAAVDVVQLGSHYGLEPTWVVDVVRGALRRGRRQTR